MNILTSYLLFKSPQKHFYVNALSGKKPESLKESNDYNDSDFNRKDHGYAHFVVRFFTPESPVWKEFQKPVYVYVSKQEVKDGKVKIRADLLEKMPNDIVLLFQDKNKIYALPREVFIVSRSLNHPDVKYVTSQMNSDYNWIHVFKINAKGIDVSNISEDKKLDDYIIKSYDYVEPVSYTKYRNRKDSRGIMLTNKTTGKRTPFKSLKQCYDLFIKPNEIMGWTKFKKDTKSSSIIVTVRETQFLIESIQPSETNQDDLNTESLNESRERAFLDPDTDGLEESRNCCNNMYIGFLQDSFKDKIS